MTSYLNYPFRKIKSEITSIYPFFRRKKQFLLDFSTFFQFLSVENRGLSCICNFLFLGYQTVSLGVSKTVFGWLVLLFTISCQQFLQNSTQKTRDPKIEKSKFHENFQKPFFTFLEVGNCKYTLFKLFKHVFRRFWPYYEDLNFSHFWDKT